jgi:hypothetical protein
MAKYRKKPVVIQATQWFCKGHKPYWADMEISETDTGFTVNTLEGLMRGSPGDWIIKGVNGEIYPIKPDIFEKTYELVKESPDA